MKKLTILSTLMLVMYLTSCVDDVFQHNTSASTDGNLVIRLKTGSSTRVAGQIEETNATEDENYINTEDIRFYFFDEDGKGINDINLKCTQQNNDEYVFSGFVPKELERQKKKIQVLVIANAQSFNKYFEDDDYKFTYPESISSIEEISTLNLKFNYPDIPYTGNSEGINEYQSWKPNPIQGEGIPMTGVSALSDELSIEKETELEVTMVRALSKIEIINTDVNNEDNYRIYVKNSTNWDNEEVYLYGWFYKNEVNTEPFGVFGANKKYDGVKSINGTTYLYFNIDKEYKGERVNLIFHTGSGGSIDQFNGPTPLYCNRDYYIEIKGDAIDGYTWSETEDFVHDGYTVYVENKTDFNTLYLYTWGDYDDLTMSWPGMPPTGKQIIDGTEYLFYDLGENANGITEQFIFSGGSDATKLDTNHKYILNKDYYFTVDFKSMKIKPLASGCKLYVKKPNDWNELYVQIPGGDRERVTVSDQINGTDYLVYTFDEDYVGQTVSITFSDGSDNQISGYQMLVSQNHYIELKNPFEIITTDETDRNKIHTCYRIYVEDNTDWNQLYLYAYSGEEKIFGEFPGKFYDGIEYVPVKEEDKEGNDVTVYKKYLYFNFWEELQGKTVNLIFNQGPDAAKIEGLDFLANVSTSESYFFVINKSGNEGQKYECVDKTDVHRDRAKGYTYHKIFVDDKTGWDPLYLYMWGDRNDLSGNWPGMTPSGTDNRGYKYFNIPTFDTEDLNEKLIFNNGTQQLSDYDFTINGDLYLKIQVDFQEITNIELDEYKIYVKDNSGWNDLRLWPYNDNFNLETVEEKTPWPGLLPSQEEKDGINYFVFDLSRYKEYIQNQTINLIFSWDNGTSDSRDVYRFDNYPYLVNSSIYLEATKPEGTWEELSPSKQPLNTNYPGNFEDIYIKEYNKTGQIIPSGITNGNTSFNVKWWANYENISSQNENNRGQNLHFVRSLEPGVWVAYVPEASLQQEEEDNEKKPIVFKIDDYITNDNPDGEKEALIRENERLLEKFLRNNLYQAKVRVGGDLNVSYTVCPWDDGTNADITFE